MADISRLNRFIAGASRGVAISGNTLLVDNLKIKMGSGNDAHYATFSGALTAARTLSMPDANVDLGQIATNKTHVDGDGSDHQDVVDLVTLSGSAANSTNHGAFDGAILGDADTTRAALQKLETAIESGSDDQTASEVPYTPNAGGDWVDPDPDDVAEALDDLAIRVTVNDTHVAGNGSDHANVATNTTHISSNGSDHSYVGNLQSLSGAGAGATVYAGNAFTGSTIADDSNIKAALQALETKAESNASLLAGWEWQNSVIDIVDNTAVPPSENSGDRYILDATGATHANWDGAEAWDIVEFDGASWVETDPSTGMVVSVDDETTSVRQWSGAAWVQKYFESTTASLGLTRDTFDIQLADKVENASGIKVLAGVITLEDLGAFDTADLSENAGNLYFTDARARTAAVSDDVYAAGWNGVTTIAPSKNAVYDKIELLDAAKQDYDVALDEAVTFFGATNLSGAEAETLSDGSNADSLHEHALISKSMVAGEAFAANTVFAVRMALTGETDTRVYKADKDASASDKFHVIGLVYPLGAVAAGESIDVVMLGEILSSVAFTAVQDEGKAVFLTAAGVLSLTPPSVAEEAIVKVGNVSKVGAAATAKIMVQGIQVMGVN